MIDVNLIVSIFFLFIYRSIGFAEIHLGVGLNILKYPQKVQELITEQFDLSLNQIGGNSDIGIYLPITDKKILIGISWNRTVHTISADLPSSPIIAVPKGNEIKIVQHLVGSSGMKFFGNEIGEGFFIRSDIGLTKISITGEYENSYKDDIQKNSNGFGFTIGAGYGISLDVSSDFKWNILFYINHSTKITDDGNYNAQFLNISLLPSSR